MEEERRLCYVAITRAKKRLTISHARQRMLYGRTSVNRPSRFLSELPEDCVEIKELPQPSWTRERSSFSTLAQQRTIRQESSALGNSRRTSEPFESRFHQGDRVCHSAFGPGLVLSVKPMGNDALMEIAFDERGTKRLMARLAGEHMKKL